MPQISLLLVDDKAPVRQGLRTLLPLAAQAVDLELAIAGEAANGCEAVEQSLALHPDVVLMDLAMPELDGCAATRAIKARQPAIRVVAFSVHSAPDVVQQAYDAGADAFVEKGAPIDRLLEAIRG